MFPPPWRDARITTIAGSGRPGYAGDAGPARSALLRQPFFVAFGRADLLLIAEDENAVVRAVDRRGRIATLAGRGGIKGDAGDNGPAARALFVEPPALAADPKTGTLYVVDCGPARVRRVDGRTGVITAFAGSGAKGFTGDGGPGTAASLREPHDVVLDGRGGLLIADVADLRVSALVKREPGGAGRKRRSERAGARASRLSPRARPARQPCKTRSRPLAR
jgi:DNA-binding beta-propeller fold protein YncE